MIIPAPVSVSHGDGHLNISPDTPITYSCSSLDWVAYHLQQQLQWQLGITLRLQHSDSEDESGVPALHLRLSPALEEISHLPFSDEGYVLAVGCQGALLEATAAQGLLYASVTLLQLLPVTAASAAGEGSAPPRPSLPCVRIVDVPRFRWRGLLLDVGRHFFGVAFVKRVLDLMLLYKLNRFHWHLCNDQGWRLEVKQFPRLTEVGAWRQAQGAERHGGFYSQQEVKEVVEYARARGITVVPEIEMPGHCVAALASYPHLSCAGEVGEVSCYVGVHEQVYCAGNEEVFSFLEGVLGEVLSLFPSTYIHVGGDEVPKVQWHKCPKCQKRIRDEGLEGEEQLQAWFLGRINAFLRSHGRRLIAWDEILEGGLCEGATVMSWRGMAGGVAAARAGHDAIMTPAHWCYLDYRQAGDAEEPGAWYAVLPLRQVYDFDPVPPEPGEAGAGAGAQQPRPASAEPMQLDAGKEGTGEGAGPPSAATKAAGGSQEGEQQGLGLAPSIPPLPRPPRGEQQEGPAASGCAGQGAGAAAAGEEGPTEEAEPLELTLTAEQATHILGGQANLWTEAVAGEGLAEYMLLPRLCAMAEALWSAREARDWPGFQRRLQAQEARWRRLGLRYRPLG